MRTRNVFLFQPETQIGTPFLTRGVQVATVQFHFNLQKCLDNNTPSLNLSMPSERTYCDQINIGLAKLQRDFDKTGYFSLFLQMSRLTKALEATLDQRNKKQELLDLDQPTPNVKWAKLMGRRTTPPKFPATEVPYIIQNDIHVCKPKEIADGFADFFGSNLVNVINTANSSLA